MPTLFQSCYQRALDHQGGEDALQAQLPKAKTARQLANVGDDRYLAEMAACIFRAGFVWRVVQNKWDGFEEVFNGFLPIWVASRSPEQLEEMASDTRIIRNLNKVKAVQDNALLVLDLQREYGSVGKFLGQWPQDDVIGLWQYLKKHGSRLGGNSGQYFLRFTGKDTFILSRDVCAALKLNGVIDRDNPTAQRDLRKIQDAFNAMHAESGWQLCQLSRMLAMSIG
ncbi:DNA-3-methyladenine glycosylase I [Litorivivens sp.]|uniref:DNA-3-methyladenine glycosylase I n=3 Tax=Litorivivens sp. TaxID=2020868 RepID=UPI0035657527